jgi:hypothetical protein
MRNLKVTLAVGIALMLAVGALTLTRSPPRVLRVDMPGTQRVLDHTAVDTTICQANEVLPRGVSAIRLAMSVFYGWNVRVVAYSGSRALTEGRRGADWTSDSVTVPVSPVDHTISHVTLCFALGPTSEPMLIVGGTTPARDAAVVSPEGTLTAKVTAGGGRPLAGRVRVEYLAAGRGSWWSRLLSVARHVGLGRVVGGTWIALLIAALMVAVGALAVRVTLRELS